MLGDGAGGADLGGEADEQEEHKTVEPRTWLDAPVDQKVLDEVGVAAGLKGLGTDADGSRQVLLNFEATDEGLTDVSALVCSRPCCCR